MLVVILVDALRHDYINAVDTPFLFNQTGQGLYCKSLQTIDGFSQRTVICTGASESASKTFSMYNLDPAHSPYNTQILNDLKYRILKTIARNTPFKKVKKAITKRLERRKNFLRSIITEQAKATCFHPNLGYIPDEIISFISMGEDNKSPIEKNGFPIESIFDIMLQEKIAFQYLMYPIYNLEDNDIQSEIATSIQSTSTDFVLSQFSMVDFIGHNYGPDSVQRRQAMGEIDRKLRELHQINPQVDFLIFGDHGMASVKDTINISAIVQTWAKKERLIHGKDYVLFLDSTVMRVLCLNEFALKALNSLMENQTLNEKGNFIRFTDSELDNPTKQALYGNCFWKAKIGTLIHPDYFHRENDVNKGMHGYGKHEPDMNSLVIGYGPSFTKNTIEKRTLYDICPTICALLNIKTPSHSIGKSLV